MEVKDESVRLDIWLWAARFFKTRSLAKSVIEAGRVEIDGVRRLKPGQLVPQDASVSLIDGPRWASRAGEKLEAGLDAFGVDPTGMACLDAGASTGGFTDVLLARGRL